MKTVAREQLLAIFQTLLDHDGPRHWWPADSAFEIMVGAILTQNTAWSNVEKAIANLKAADACDPAVIGAVDHDTLAGWLKPSGYFNVKAKRLRAYCDWYLSAGGFDALNRLDDATLRTRVLSVNGVGPETADDILLYAFERPVFVIDAYTWRLFSRLGLIPAKGQYEALRAWFESTLGPDVSLFNEYHALIDGHASRVCRPRPLCNDCCLRALCPRKGCEPAAGSIAPTR